MSSEYDLVVDEQGQKWRVYADGRRVRDDSPEPMMMKRFDPAGEEPLHRPLIGGGWQE